MNLSKQAILVAGMHRSGTSALTRVLSLLGAHLPKKLAPALPNNNETGFWESVDLMILHDELLTSGGSSWSDWSEFNPDWCQSAAGAQYRQQLIDIIEHDFKDSSLFVVKDPRICRFLPLWVEALTELNIAPHVIIPVRNPLEVAQSLQRRDGFSIAKGGLLWLRHVLDAVHFSAGLPRAFVSYELLLEDWQSGVSAISEQAGIVFPRRSVESELDIDAYLDEKQKHNAATIADVLACKEFSPFVSQVYKDLSVLIDAPNNSESLHSLAELRKVFNADSHLYAKAAAAEQRLYKQIIQQEKNEGKKTVQGYEQRIEDYEVRLSDQVSEYEGRVQSYEKRIKDYEVRLSDQVDGYEERIQRYEQRIQDYEMRLADQMDGYEERIKDYERRLSDQKESYVSRLAIQGDEQASCVQNYESRLNDQARDYEQLVQAKELALAEQLQKYTDLLAQQENDHQQHQHEWYEQSRLSLLAKEIADKKSVGYRREIILLKEREASSSLSNKLNELFDTEWYLEHYPDVKKADSDAFDHYMAMGWQEGRQPHPLFDGVWYVSKYPDIKEAGLNPLEHFVNHGGAEVRDPHPLFNSEYYVQHYPDALSAGLSPLEHYLKYGSDWGFNPHPLFDAHYYQRQLREDIPAGTSLLAHFLQKKRVWRLSPCACFDSDWYLERYPDVLESNMNPLLHFVVHGAQDGRQPHPQSNTADFQQQYGALFASAGLPFTSVVSSPEPAVLAVSSLAESVPHSVTQPAPVSDPRFTRMLDFPVRELQPDSTVFTENQLVIHWVTCDFARQGGGGNMTIFRFVRLFELIGHKQHIWLHNKVTHTRPESAYEDLVRHYQQTSAQIHFISDDKPSFEAAAGDIIIATDWESVWPVLSAQYFKRRFYFVQDHEPSFFASGGHSLAAEATYHEELDCICAGPWLEKLMQERYGRWATKFWLAADQAIYYPAAQSVQNETPRIAFYARVATSRRAVELGLLALEHLAQQGGVAFHVDVYGGDDNSIRLQNAQFSWTDHGVLDADSLGNLYRQCDIGLVFSATNYSLVPQEMMACGLAVLEMDGENTRTVFPEGCIALTMPHPRAIAARLSKLLTDREARQHIADAGAHWAAQFDWEKSVRAVNKAVQQRLLDLGYNKQKIKAENVKASVVIPTWNGGDLLIEVLDVLQTQKVPWSFEVLVIDSGSTDGTLEKMQARSGLKVHSIPQSAFSHGGTRNLGVEMTEGEYIAFLTQDALPADEFWLFHLISALEHDSAAAGAFGKHLPYPEASPFVKRDLQAHFENLGKHPLYLSKNTDPERFDSGDQGWRQVLHFYSDNNSCLRRSVWEQIPYPVIEYGEDQVWADQIIKAGYKKAYAINAVVYHSHDYDEQETFERSRTESEFF